MSGGKYNSRTFRRYYTGACDYKLHQVIFRDAESDAVIVRCPGISTRDTCHASIYEYRLPTRSYEQRAARNLQHSAGQRNTDLRSRFYTIHAAGLGNYLTRKLHICGFSRCCCITYTSFAQCIYCICMSGIFGRRLELSVATEYSARYNHICIMQLTIHIEKLTLAAVCRRGELICYVLYDLGIQNLTGVLPLIGCRLDEVTISVQGFALFLRECMCLFIQWCDYRYRILLGLGCKNLICELNKLCNRLSAVEADSAVCEVGICLQLSGKCETCLLTHAGYGMEQTYILILGDNCIEHRCGLDDRIRRLFDSDAGWCICKLSRSISINSLTAFRQLHVTNVCEPGVAERSEHIYRLDVHHVTSLYFALIEERRDQYKLLLELEHRHAQCLCVLVILLDKLKCDTIVREVRELIYDNGICQYAELLLECRLRILGCLFVHSLLNNEFSH